MNAPACINSLHNGAISNAGRYRPIHQGLPFSIIFYDYIRGFVSRLLCRRNPPAILFTVAFVIVSPIERKPITRTTAHVCMECSERSSPPITNSYSTTAVSIVRLVCSHIASIQHVSPCAICRCHIVALCMSMKRASFDGLLVAKTSTRFGPAQFNCPPSHDSLSSAIAPTEIAGAFRICSRRFSQYCPAIEF